MTEAEKRPRKKATPSKEKKEPRKKKVKLAPEAAAEVPAVPVEAKPKVAIEIPRIEPKHRLPEGPKYYGTGRRKEATAKVWLTPGTGQIRLNARPLSEYFCGRKLLEFQAGRPLAVTQTEGKYDVHADVFGGGVPGQAVAVSLGIARALVQLNPEFKILLKRQGLLTRDPRMKERKKYGLKRARRAFQYTKR